MAVQFGNQFLKDMWALYRSTRLNTSGQIKFCLIKADFTFNQDLGSTQFTEADFPGYGEIDATALAFGVPYMNMSDYGETDAATAITWTCSGTPSGGLQNIYGWFTKQPGATPTDVHWCEKFPAPVSLTTTGQFISLQPTMIDKPC